MRVENTEEAVWYEPLRFFIFVKANLYWPVSPMVGSVNVTVFHYIFSPDIIVNYGKNVILLVLCCIL